MALDTVTTVTTISDYIEPPESFTITTAHIWATIIATPGETITLSQPLPSAAPTLQYTPAFTPTQTFTATEYDVWLRGPQGNAYSETVIDISPTELGAFNPQFAPGETVLVVPCPCSGWSCWSTGQKVGLILGVVFGVLLLLSSLCCLQRWRKRNIWVSHGAHGSSDYERWQNSHPGWGYCGPPQANLHTGWGLRPYVPPVQAEAPLRGGGGPPPAPGIAGGKANDESRESKGSRQKLTAWIAG